MASPTLQSPGARNWALMLFLSVVWGGAFLGTAIALEGFGPIWVAALRTGLAALALLTIGAAMGQGLGHIPGARGWSYAAAIGAGAVALPFFLLSWGLLHVPSAFAGVAMGTVPLWLVPLVFVFSPEEGIGPRRIAGVALGFVGLVVLIGKDAAEASGAALEIWGRVACISAAACYAVGSVLTRRSPAMPPVTLSAATMLVAAVVLVPFALVLEGVPDWPATRPLVAILFVALVPTALAAVLRVQVIRSAGSMFMTLVSYLVPAWAVILGVTLAGEDLPPQLYAALALILSGILLSQWRSLFGRG